MATSTFLGYIRHDAAQLTENSARGAGPARDHLVNNANHIADGQAQVLINWTAGTNVAADSGAPGYLTPTLSGGALVDTGTYYRVTQFGPFPLLRKDTGASYILRGRLRWYLAAAGTGTARVVITSPARSVLVRETAAATNAFTFTTTVTTDAWDDADTDNIASLDADEMSIISTEMSTLSAVAGDDVSVFLPLAYVDVWVKSTATTAVPRITGLYLAEYIGT